MSYPAAAGSWSNPPPPGTCQVDSEASSSASHDDKSISKHKKDHKSRVSKHHNKRRRSRSRSHHRRRHYRSSRSSSIERSRHSRRSHRKRYSRSRSRSHSHSRRRHYKHRGTHSRRKSRSRSYSRSWSRERRHRKSRSHSSSRSNRKGSVSDNDESGPSQENTFKNDGSFLEMFKKMQEQQMAAETKPLNDSTATETMKKQPLPVFGKRRGGRILKTGLVEKPKSINPVEEEEPKDAWSIYMKEVKRYKEACCDDDSKTRPLVK